MKRAFSVSDIREALEDGIVPSTMRRVKYVPCHPKFLILKLSQIEPLVRRLTHATCPTNVQITGQRLEGSRPGG